MNRSFSVNRHHHQMVKDKEDDLALFLEIRKREKERNDLLNNAEEFDAPLGKLIGHFINKQNSTGDTKMVERVINLRKLIPPKQDENHSPRSNLSGKLATSPDSSGFGQTLSKKSLDMAMRHMDIRRSIPGNLRTFFTNIPASSMYSVRTGPMRSRTGSVWDSPLATSSDASSEVSVNNNGICVELNELLSEDSVRFRNSHSPSSR